MSVRVLSVCITASHACMPRTLEAGKGGVGSCGTRAIDLLSAAV